jgi:hypothetical protein
MILREVTSNQRGLKIQPSDLQKSHRHEKEYDCGCFCKRDLLECGQPPKLIRRPEEMTGIPEQTKEQKERIGRSVGCQTQQS